MNRKNWTKIFLPLLVSLTLTVSAAAAPELHPIPYPDGYPTHQDEDGADAFENSLDHPDSRYYVINDFYNMKSDETLHLIPQFQTYQQTTEYSCGCAAALMVLHHFGVTGYDEMQIGELVHVDTEHGTAVPELIQFFENLGWKTESHASTEPYFETPEEFEAYALEKIDRNVPILLDWVDWAGHWQVLIGIDTCGTESVYDDVMILADPYDITDHYQDGYYTYPLGRFFTMWQEGPCTLNEIPLVQPFLTAEPN